MVAEGGDNPFNAETVAKVMAEWTGEQTPERVSAISAWRDTRLAALRAHKSAAKRKPKQS
jgi:L-gulonate 3-dehydrogenase